MANRLVDLIIRRLFSRNGTSTSTNNSLANDSMNLSRFHAPVYGTALLLLLAACKGSSGTTQLGASAPAGTPSVYVLRGQDGQVHVIEVNDENRDSIKDVLKAKNIRINELANDADIPVFEKDIIAYYETAAVNSGADYASHGGVPFQAVFTGAGDKVGADSSHVTNLFLAAAGSNAYTGGGNGADNILSYAHAPSGVRIDLSVKEQTDSSDDSSWAHGDSITNIEHIIGSDHSDVLTGNGRDNTLEGGKQDDTLEGGGGADTLEGGGGADTLDGGEGTDTASYAGSSKGVVVDLAPDVDGDGVVDKDEDGFITVSSEGDADGDKLKSIENLIGSAHDDTLTGNDADNVIEGRGGDDTLGGRAGADRLDGGGGFDTASYAGSSEGVTVNLSDNSQNAGGYAAGDMLNSIENLIGSVHVDTLIGDMGNNVIEGGAGGDTLDGRAGVDTLDGGAGIDTVTYAASSKGVRVNLSDTDDDGFSKASGGDAQGDKLKNIENLIGTSQGDKLTGSNGANRLHGEAGDDELDGGIDKKRDTLIGGTGKDVFVLSSKATTIVDADIITDWGFGGTDDKLKLTADLDEVWYEVDEANPRIVLYGAGDGGLVLAVLKGVTDAPVVGDFETGNAPFTITEYGLDAEIRGEFAQDSVTVTVNENTDLSKNPNVTGALKGGGITGTGTFSPSVFAAFRLQGDGSPDDAELFEINPALGAVTWKVSEVELDHETKQSYSFTIEYVFGTEVLGSQAVTVQVVDVNDEAPEFTSLARADLLDGRLYLPVDDDNYDATADVVYTAVAKADVDDDDDDVVYSLTAGDDVFDIDSETGEVTFDRAVRADADTAQQNYQFTVQASVTSGGRTQTASRTVTLDVPDVNDEAPEFTSLGRADLLDGRHYRPVSDDNYDVTRHVVYKAVAKADVDDDDDDVVYSLTAGDDVFDIDSETGEVTFDRAVRADADTAQQNYQFTVQASVTSGDRTQTASRTVTLDVPDVNDEAPEFTHTHAAPENVLAGQAFKGDDGFVIYRATATPDVMNAPITWSLEGVVAAMFNIVDGEVRFAKDNVAGHTTTDAPGQASYNFTVKASTGTGANVLSSRQAVIWTVDAAPPDDFSKFATPTGGALGGDANTDNILYAGPSADTFDGNTGTNTVSYRWSHESVTVDLSDNNNAGGTAAGDSFSNVQNLIGSTFVDTLTGDALDNVIEGGRNGDNINGGDGSDTASYAGAAVVAQYTVAQNAPNRLAAAVNGVTGVYVNLNVSGAQNEEATEDTDATGDVLSNIENLLGSAYNDVLVGDNEANVISGGAGDDILIGGDGNDTLNGGAGDDMFFSGTGNNANNGNYRDGADQINGGDGIDTVSYAAAVDWVRLVYDHANFVFEEKTLEAFVEVDLGSEAASIGAHAKGDVLTNIENLIGSIGNDVLTGNGSNNEIRGGDGDDEIRGVAGNDELYGDAGDDEIFGGYGNDTIYGGAGEDTIYGDAGNDIISGGDGDDTIDGGGGRDTLTGGGGADKFVLDTTQRNPTSYNKTITDFDSAAGDKIILHGARGDEASLANFGTAQDGLMAVVSSGNDAHITIYIGGRIMAASTFMIINDVDSNDINNNFSSYFELEVS